MLATEWKLEDALDVRWEEGLPLELIRKITKLPDEDVQRLMECGQ